MNRLGTSIVAGLAVLGLALASGSAAAGTNDGSDAPAATDVGVTAKEVRIAVIADVDNPFQPGLFQGSVDAVKGVAKTINQQGGIGGRKVVVDFYDSKLNPNESRNAIIKACQNDFAIIGSATLFLTSVDDQVNCVDQAGAAIGLPEVGGIVTGVQHQCADVSFPAQPPQLLCDTADQHPQTYQGQQGPTKWLLANVDRDLHGAAILPNDTKDAYRGIKVQVDVLHEAGIELDQEVTKSGRDPQSAYTPVVQQLKTDGSNYVFDGLSFSQMVEVQQEAALQNVDSSEVTWQCTGACYDERYLETGGSVTEGTFMWLAYLPFAETKYNKALATMVRNVGSSNMTGLGVYSYVAGLAFQQVMNDVVAEQGVNGVTRQHLLDRLRTLTKFDAGGIIGSTDIADKKTSNCFVLIQVKDGKFVRVHPTKPGTFDCKKSNYTTIQADLFE